jgi:diaminopropionate ammonia-lyase
VPECFTSEQSQAALSRISTWPSYGVTPLLRLPRAAKRMGIAELLCKDEGARLGLESFKALGAVYASVAILSDWLARRTGMAVGDAELLSGGYRHLLKDVVLTSATDGNHGFSLAYAARSMGCRARIFIPHGVSPGRADALRRQGAEVVRIDGIYEEAMQAAVAAAETDPDTFLISDYATPDYQAVPRLCMAGYSAIIHEVAAQMGDLPPTHILAPAGCGGLAAAIITSGAQLWRNAAPRVIIVEPTRAACVFASAEAGEAVRIEGDLDTIMGGLACAAVSAVAWPTLRDGAMAFMQIDDGAAIEAMRFLARPEGGDPAIVSGETGAAGMAALIAVHADAAARAALDLTEHSRVLVISCESATDPDLYRELVGSVEGPVDTAVK